MVFLVVGLIAAVVLVLVGRQIRTRDFARRLAPTLAALLAAIGAVAAGLRGEWIVGVVLIGLALYLGRVAGARTAAPPVSGGISPVEARAVLGVGPGAGRDEIEAAYRRLILRTHPDHGGSSGLAAQLNAARDCLIKNL
jgi:hypothetical protein